MASCKTQKLEVLHSKAKRKRWSPEEKKAIVEETYAPAMSVTLVSRKHGIAPHQLFNWRRAMENGALTAVGSGDDVVTAAEHRKALERIQRLERMLGRQTEKVELLMEAVRIGREKKLISRMPLVGLDDFQ